MKKDRNFMHKTKKYMPAIKVVEAWNDQCNRKRGMLHKTTYLSFIPVQ
jgi:hypothetical protein